MTERPIPFKGPMVRAILEGRKTMTRRVMKPQPYETVGGIGSMIAWHDFRWCRGASIPDVAVECPYGPVGGRLWVRETWRAEWRGCQWQGDEYPAFGIRYNADDSWQERNWPVVEHAPWYGPWRPSILMPRWASRITLEVTGVRVERVQDISEEDAVKEGVDSRDDTARRAFAMLWNSINAKRGFGWETNPWVWVIEFRRVDQ